MTSYFGRIQIISKTGHFLNYGRVSVQQWLPDSRSGDAGGISETLFSLNIPGEWTTLPVALDRIETFYT